MPSHHPPTTSAAAQMNALTSAQHYAALTQQYHAAAAMQAFTGSNPMAAQAQAAQLLAQYQQSLATSLTPDMILQQYPHLKAAGLAAPPHMLGRNPATDHMHMLQAREREVQMERERQSRWEISGLILGFYRTIMHTLEIDFEKKSSKLDGSINYFKKRFALIFSLWKKPIF